MSARSLYFCLSLLIALLIPIQMSIGQTASHVGLRINAADILMPISILTALFLIWRGAGIPRFIVPHLPLWLFGLSLIIIFAFFNGVIIYGHVSSWALINRVVGWFILLGFFATGAGVSTWLTPPQKIKIIGLFCLGVLATAFFCGLGIIFGPGPAVTTFAPILYPLEGFMSDRNAFALIVLCTYALTICLAANLLEQKWLRRMAIVATFLMPCIGYLNYSLSGLITFGVLFLILLAWYARTLGRDQILALMAGTLLMAGMLQIYTQPKTGINIVYRLDKISQAAFVDSDTRLFSSDNLRLETYTQALDLWRARPVTGIGLGGFMTVRDQNHQTLAVLDSTPIWILTEMGIIGLLGFLGFGTMVARALLFGPDTPEPMTRALMTGGILIMVAFVMMSSVLQLLYLRPLWFLMGMVLTRQKTSPNKY